MKTAPTRRRVRHSDKEVYRTSDELRLAREVRKQAVLGSSVPNAGGAAVCPVHGQIDVEIVDAPQDHRTVYQCMVCGMILGDAPRGQKATTAAMAWKMEL